MKFNYLANNREESLKQVGTFNCSLFTQYVNADNFKPETTLREIADSIRTFLEMEKGEVELVIGFNYRKFQPKKVGE